MHLFSTVFCIDRVMMMDTIYAFDLDGTITLDETLPLLAKELDLWDEMRILTELTLEGKIHFFQSFDVNAGWKVFTIASTSSTMSSLLP